MSSLRFLTSPLSGSLESRADGKPVLRHSSPTDASAAGRRRVSRFCSWATVTLLLAAPTLRLVNAVNERMANTSWATLSPASAVSAVRGLSAQLNGEPVFTADEIQKKAVPLLARLTSVPGEPEAIRGMAGRRDGSTQHLWTVEYRDAASRDVASSDAVAEGTAPEELLHKLAEATYDADTGELTSASTLCDLTGRPYVVGSERARPLTANEAVAEARMWLPKLGLWGCSGQSGQSPPSPVVFAPQKTSSGQWRVWLRGRETLGGPQLTVLVAVSNQTEVLVQATVVERAAYPRFYLPRLAPRR